MTMNAHIVNGASGMPHALDSETRGADATPAFRHVRSGGGIEEYRLDANGLRVLFMEARAAPVALLMLTYGVGSRHEGHGFHGASHMLEHLMFKGSARFNKQQGTSIFNLLHPVGAQTNATTWLDRTNYFNLVPVSHLDVAAEIEADRMRNIRIDPVDLETERTVVLNEHDQYAGDPLEKLNQAVWRIAFAKHPYGAPVIGTREDIGAFTRDGLFEHYHRHYWPNNATLTVIGDLGRELTLDIVGRHFGRMSGFDSLPNADDEFEPEQRGERRIVVEQPGQAGWVMLACKAPNGLSPDTDALELLGCILAGGKLSRLYRQLVVGGLATAVWPCMSRLAKPGLFQVQALLGTDQDHQGVERTIRDAIDTIRIHGVSQDELDRAKGRARGNLLTSRDGPVAVAMQLNEAIAAGDWMAYPMAIERLDAVSVTDVQRVARQYLIDDALTVGYLVDPDGKRAASASSNRASVQ